jgi:hypothetical protein
LVLKRGWADAATADADPPRDDVPKFMRNNCGARGEKEESSDEARGDVKRREEVEREV